MTTRAEIVAKFMDEDPEKALKPTPDTPGGGRAAIVAKYMEADPETAFKPVAEPEAKERSLLEDARDSLGALTQGLTFGGADEVGSALSATIAQLTGLAPEDESWGSTYDQMMEFNKIQRDEFSEAYPVADTALQLAGGIATGGAGAGRVLASQAVKQSPRLVKALAPIAVGAVEGGIGGGLTAQQGERAEGAVTGTALGAGFSALPQAGKKLFDGVTKRRVAQELGEGADFIPLNQADEGALGDFYRSILGKTFGGRQPLIDQSARQVGTATRRLSAATDKLASAKNAKSEAIRRGKAAIDKRYALKATEAEDAATASVRQAQRLADESVESATNDMTRELVEAAIPDSIPADTAAKIRAASPDMADGLLDKAWRDYGFKLLDSKTYTVTADDVKTQFKKVLGRDPAMQEAAAGFESMVDDIFEAYGTKSGTISGKAIMELRNAMKSVKGGEGRAALIPAAYGKMADQLDVLLKRTMSAAEKAIFDDDLAKYAGKKSLSKAVTNARTTRQGIPNEADVIGAARVSRGGGKYGQGQGLAQSAAENVQIKRALGKESVEAAEAQASEGLALAKAKLAQGKNALKQGTNRTGNKALQRAQANRNAAAARKAAIKAASPAENVSMFERLFATGLTGFGYGLGNLASGTSLSRGLTTEAAQRALAGQTSKQKLLAEWLRRNGGNWDAISAGMGGAAGTEADEF